MSIPCCVSVWYDTVRFVCDVVLLFVCLAVFGKLFSVRVHAFNGVLSFCIFGVLAVCSFHFGFEVRHCMVFSVRVRI